jgi:hypothetical protein
MVESSVRLGRHRWTIERTGAWLGGFRRLRIRYERSSERFYALAMLACSVICFNTLQQPPWWPLRNVLHGALAPAPLRDRQCREVAQVGAAWATAVLR